MLRGIHIIDHKKVETGPEVLTLAEVKTHLAINSSNTDFDVELTAMIKRCRQVVENYCSVSIIAKTITLYAKFYEEWELPYGPVTGIVSVQSGKNNEGSGPRQYETVENWRTDGEDFPTLFPGGHCCSTRSYSLRLKIVYTVGYTEVPEDLKLGILNEISFRFEHKGDNSDEVKSTAAIDLIMPYKRMIWL